MDKKILTKTITIICFLLLVLFQPVFGQIKIVQFKDKPYYSKLFDAKALSKLKKADKYYASMKQYNIKANTKRNEIKPLEKKLKEKITESDKKIINSKISRLNKKYYKFSAKAYNKSTDGNVLKQLVYMENLKRIKPKDQKTIPIAILQIENDLVLKFNSAQKARTEAIKLVGEAKLDKLQLADEFDTDALINYETVLGYYMEDKDIRAKYPLNVVVADNTITSPVINSTIIPIVINNPVKNSTENQTTIPNNQTNTLQNQVINQQTYQINTSQSQGIYQSQENRLLGDLKLTSVEKNNFVVANQNIDKGDVLFKEGRNIFLSIDSLKSKAVGFADEAEKKKLLEEAERMNTTMIAKNLKAVNLLLSSNKSKYQIYAGKISSVRLAGNSLESRRGMQFEKEATTNCEIAKSKVNTVVNKSENIDKFIVLMEANGYYINALTGIEKALLIYLRKTGLSDEDIKLARTDSSLVSKPIKQALNETNSFAGFYKYTDVKIAGEKIGKEAGLVFRILIGNYEVVPIKWLDVLSPLTEERYSNESKCYLGELRTFEAAEKLIPTVQKSISKNCKIVAFKNSGIISMVEAKNLIKQGKYMTNAEYKSAKEKEIEAINAGLNSSNQVTKNEKGVNNIKDTKGLVYTIQIGLFATPPTQAQLKNQSPVYKFTTNSGDKYSIGSYHNHKMAQENLKAVKNAGFAKSFISAYYNGKPIEISEARKKENGKDSVSTTVVTSAVVYKVQIGVFGDGNKFTELPKEFNLEKTKDENGLFVYTVGHCATYSAAEKMKDQLAKTGVNGYVVSYKNNQKQTDVKKKPIKK